MQSQIMNPCYQTRYRNIGHKRVSSISDSSTSESSCNQNSPEYLNNRNVYTPNIKFKHTYIKNREESGQYLNNDRLDQDESEHDDTHSAEDKTENSSDEEEICHTEQTSNVYKTISNDNLIYEPNKESIGNNILYNDQLINVTLGNKDTEDEDINLVEGTDYEVIHYYRINPNIEGSDDEIDSSLTSDVIEVVSVDPNAEQINDSISTDVGSPSVSNVEDCFQNKEEELSNIKDESDVNDVEEYFNQSSESSDVSIKVETPMNIDTTLNENNRAYIDEYFVKPTESVEETSLKTEETCIEEISKLPTAEKSGINSEEVTNVMELILKEEVDVPPFPHLEELKNFLEDMPDTSFKSKPHKSCSFPTSPMRNLNMDVDVIKPSLTFEDLDLYFSDLPFDHIKEKSFNVDSKIDDVPRILTDEDVNGFFITDTNPTKEVINPNCDDLTHQDMELENTVESPLCISYMRSSTPVPQSVNVMETPVQKSVRKNKTNMEVDDFIDVESCNDVVIPVLEANNVSSLLEQFEATEKFNCNPNNSKSNLDEAKNGLVSGMRLQDAGVQLHKNKIRKILMINTPVIRRSPSPVVSDHDYCSPKKAHNVSQLKSGQSLLKPEVLSRNNEILNSRHRSCKNKQVVYHQSSDEETEKKIKKSCKNKDLKHKKGKKTSNQNKLLPPHSDGDASNSKCNSTVIPNESVSKPSENGSQPNSGSIKLIIKNKSVIINNLVENITEENVKLKSINMEKVEDDVKIENKSNHVNNIKSEPVDNTAPKTFKTEVTKPEEFYNELFTNKSDVKLPKNIQEKISKKSFEEEMKLLTINAVKKESEQTVKKRKLNLQEYKRRRVVGSNNSSAAVSPELIFPDLNCPVVDNVIVVPKTPPKEVVKEMKPAELPKVFDPIAEASRKILLQTKKKKEKRKRDEDIIIPKVEITDLLPLITEPSLTTTSNEVPQTSFKSKRHSPFSYEEIILVSVGTNTDENVFSQIGGQIENKKMMQISDSKSHINFKIKKSDHVSKENVFDSTKKSRHIGEKSENKNNKDRYKNITATLKSVEKKVETKITSNSLFASIQDVVMKKATKDVKKSDKDNRISKSNSPTEKFNATSLPIKTEIIRDFDVAMEHGEDKVILHLEKCRKKPNTSDGVTQTVLPAWTEAPAKRCRKDSDMSIESDGSPVRPSTHIVEQKESKIVKSDNKKEYTVAKTDVKAFKRSRSNERLYTSHDKRSKSREKNSRFKLRRSRSKDRRSRTKYPIRRSRSKHRRSRSRSRRSKSRKSRSYEHYRYRRSVSPYRTNRRLRSPCHSRRSPSYNRDYCKRSRSKSKSTNRHRIASPAPKKIKLGPQTNQQSKNQSPYRLPKLNSTRKPTISESSSTSSLSSSSLSSSSSSSLSFTSFSEKSRGSYKSQKSSNYKNDTVRRKEMSPFFTLEDRENNKPVEERRIVFVGKLEREITKQSLRSKFSKFGYIIEVRIHSKEDGTRYGFVTYERARDACTAVESASQFPQYDVGFGGRRAFCRQSYADLDGLKEYAESSFHGSNAMPSRRNEDMSFEQMLMDVKKKLSQRKNEQKQEKP